MFAAARNPEAVALGLALLDRAFSASRLGRIRFLLGQAYLGSAQPDHAATLLAEARAHFEAVNDGVMLAECIGAQAALANMTQSKDAVALAELALSVCRRLKPVPAPTEVRLLGILAGATSPTVSGIARSPRTKRRSRPAVRCSTCAGLRACTARSAPRTRRLGRGRPPPGTRCARSWSSRCCAAGSRSLARRTTWAGSGWPAGTGTPPA